MSISLHNKVALVTGANRGIGKSIVERFITEGVSKVYLAVRSTDSVHDLVDKHGETVVPIALDLSRPASIAALADLAPDVQVVVNNAGVLIPAGPLDEHFEAAFETELTVNTLGLVRVARALAPAMARNGDGALVQLNSVASILNFTGFTSYSASKAATWSITQGLRDALGERGVHVLSVHPGPIATDMGDQVGMTDVAEPASVVADGIVNALAAGEFIVFPDQMARQIGAAYQSYARNVIETHKDEANAA